ncbi:hypothetical protein B0H19DRAFT_1073334 [Mycena capillaripes]|nr:hypothetical protein B0H19DRAFT_1073334 [Mycena capillaripes]
MTLLWHDKAAGIYGYFYFSNTGQLEEGQKGNRIEREETYMVVEEGKEEWLTAEGQTWAISNRPHLYVEARLRLNFPSHIPTPATSLPKFCLTFFGATIAPRKFIVEIPVVKKPTPQQFLLGRFKPWMAAIETLIGGRMYYLKSDLVRATSRHQEAIRLDRFQGTDDNGECIREREMPLLKAWDQNDVNRWTAQEVLRWQKTLYTQARQMLDKNTSKHFSAFFMIQPIVLREAFLVQVGLPPPSFQYRILCPLCNDKKTFLVDNLVIHINHKHPDDFLRVRDTYNTTPGFKYCELCPQSMKIFEMAGMRKHMATKRWVEETNPELKIVHRVEILAI